MLSVTFQPGDVIAEATAGANLLDVARAAGVAIDAPCGGKGTCGKCVVKIVAGQVDSASLGVLSRTAVADGYVLACKSTVLEQDVTVEVPVTMGRKGGKFSDSADDAWLVREDLLPRRWEYEPLAVKWLIEVPNAELEDGLSDLDRLVRAVQQQWGKVPVIVPLPVIRRIGDALRQEDGSVTVTLIREDGRLRLCNVEAGDTTVRHYGVAIDVGTTTVAVQLIEMPLAEIVSTRSDYNAQLDCGLDVISRINYSLRPGGLDELRRLVLGTVNGLIQQVAETHGVMPHEISNAVVSGNTTMMHLMLGMNPEYIRLEPYTPTMLDIPFIPASEIGLNINAESSVCFSPCVGSYVGGDITAGVLCTDLAADKDEISLFIDIGTNGELVVGNRDFLLACACSAGPAFEGGGIGCGMRAAVGAIDRVRIDPDTGAAEFWTIGNVPPRGICGSGMISLLADLFLDGWLDGAGRLNRERSSPVIQMDGRNARYVLVPAEASATGEPITISELDIGNIIRAKAAIYSACSLMLDQVGLRFEDLAHIYIAGGFGRFLDLEKATVLGLVPDLPREKFHYIGNSSLLGSYMSLVSRDFHQRQMDLASRMTYVELSTDPAYMDQYTGALFLPHTDPDLFPSVRVVG